MKQLILTDEQYDFIKSLSEQIKNEHVRLVPEHITGNPCFCVYQKDYEYAESGWHFEEGWADCEGIWIRTDEVFGYVKECLKSGCEFESRRFDQIMAEMGFSRRSRKEGKKFVGAYLTSKAAQKHIEENSYHYDKPFIFVESFWRNKEMQTLRNLLMSLEFENKSVELAEAV
jgi:hypothetical protein